LRAYAPAERHMIDGPRRPVSPSAAWDVRPSTRLRAGRRPASARVQPFSQKSRALLDAVIAETAGRADRPGRGGNWPIPDPVARVRRGFLDGPVSSSRPRDLSMNRGDRTPNPVGPPSDVAKRMLAPPRAGELRTSVVKPRRRMPVCCGPNFGAGRSRYTRVAKCPKWIAHVPLATNASGDGQPRFVSTVLQKKTTPAPGHKPDPHRPIHIRAFLRFRSFPHRSWILVSTLMLAPWRRRRWCTQPNFRSMIWARPLARQIPLSLL